MLSLLLYNIFIGGHLLCSKALVNIAPSSKRINPTVESPVETLRYGNYALKEDMACERAERGIERGVGTTPGGGPPPHSRCDLDHP